MKKMRNASRTIGAVCLAAAAASAAFGQDAARSDLPMVQRAVHVCASCHGEGGNSTAPVFPKLAGQQPNYTVAQLKAFRDQKRYETDTQAYMWGISALLDDDTIQGLADYFAAQTPAPGKTGNPALMKKGKEIFEQGIPAKGVRACASCHGENAEGAAVFPRLAGQHAAYVVNQLNVFHTRLRPHGVIMSRMTQNLSAAEIRAVAEYVQSK